MRIFIRRCNLSEGKRLCVEYIEGLKLLGMEKKYVVIKTENGGR